MGLGLSHPITSKRLYRIGNKNFKIGMATMHGWRESMEDAHCVELSLPKHQDYAFFGIFDGHSGSLCANYMAENLHKNIDSVEDFSDLEALGKTCIKTDEQFLSAEQFLYNDDGCACIFTLCQNLDGKVTLINGNIGDSRTIFAQKQEKKEGETPTETYKAVPCSFDHKPTDAKEKERIEAAKGYVSLQRVDGQLALSRAFGDRQLKTPVDFPGEKKKVTSNPDFILVNDGNSNDFLFMACDGIYEADIFTRQDVINLIAVKMETTDDLALICSQVLDECLERGSHDNMSAMIVQFVDGTDYARSVEFVPGPWYDGDQDKKFQSAYTADALSAGFSLEKALALRKENEAKKQQKQQVPTTIASPTTTATGST